MKGGSSTVQEGDEVVVAGIGARLPGRQNWFQDEADRGSPRWTRGFCGIKNDVGEVFIYYLQLSCEGNFFIG